MMIAVGSFACIASVESQQALIQSHHQHVQLQLVSRQHHLLMHQHTHPLAPCRHLTRQHSPTYVSSQTQVLMVEEI